MTFHRAPGSDLETLLTALFVIGLAALILLRPRGWR